MFGNEILENKRTPELVNAAETSFNELLHAVKACQEKKLIRLINPFIIANTLWSLTHGISMLLIDGQIQSANAFRGMPAMLQPDSEAGKIDVRKIFEYKSDILFAGLIADA
jgi:hypothetical protein